MELRLPKDGEVTEGDHEASTRLGDVRILGIFDRVKTGEVGIHVAIQRDTTVGLDDDALVLGSLEVATEAFDSRLVRETRVDAEAATLVDGEGAIGTRVIAEVHGNSNG